MTQHTNKGGPAYPTIRYCDERPIGMTPGMTLRDWFAGQALAGYLSSFSGVDCSLPARDNAARMAYEYADAMLAQRDKTEGRS